MSFWGGVFGGGKSNTDFPSSSSSARSPKTQEAPHISPRSPAPPPTTTTAITAGPPPTATAYIHSPREAATVVQPAVVQPDAILPPPTFHIFQPKLHDKKSKKQQDWGAVDDQTEAEQPQDLAEPQPSASQPEAPRIYNETTAEEPTEDPGSFDDDFDWEEQSRDTEEDVPSQEAAPMTPEPIITDQICRYRL